MRGARAPRRSTSAVRISMVVVVVAVLAADAALLYYAYGAMSEHPAAAPLYVPEPEPTVEFTPEPVLPDAPLQTRIIAAFSDTNAWFVERGACPGEPVASKRTEDGGATFLDSDLGRKLQITQVTAVDIDPEFLGIKAVDADCASTFVASFTEGQFWKEYPKGIGERYWYVNPQTPGVVESPEGSKPTPCSSIASFARAANDIGVLCSTRQLFRSVDSGASWDEGVLLRGATAIAIRDGGYTVAAFGQRDCDGIAFYPYRLILEGEEEPEPVGCWVGDPAAGDVTLANAVGVLWMWVGDAIVRSFDGGATWQ